MSMDISEAIALAKDLLRTSSDFHAHDPEMAAQFAGRAYEICDDLGIDRAEIGEPAQSLETVLLVDEEEAEDDDDDDDDPVDHPADDDDDSEEISQQLRHLLQQQAQVLRDMEESEAAPPPKAKKRSFKLFGRSQDQDEETRELQSA